MYVIKVCFGARALSCVCVCVCVCVRVCLSLCVVWWFYVFKNIFNHYFVSFVLFVLFGFKNFYYLIVVCQLLFVGFIPLSLYDLGLV